MDDILNKNHEAGMTLKAGCGIGYEFSTLRPRGSFVSGAGAHTSGPLSFMDIFDKMCFTVSSAGGRRGAHGVRRIACPVCRAPWCSRDEERVQQLGRDGELQYERLQRVHHSMVEAFTDVRQTAEKLIFYVSFTVRSRTQATAMSMRSMSMFMMLFMMFTITATKQQQLSASSSLRPSRQGSSGCALSTYAQRIRRDACASTTKAPAHRVSQPTSSATCM